MKPASLLLLMILSLAACDSTRDNRIATYAKSPDKRTVTVDEAKIYVVQDQFGEYVAWGGPTLKEKGYASYRRMRAIEQVSGCRIDKVMAKSRGQVLRATVNC